MRTLQATTAGIRRNRRQVTQVLAYAVIAASLGTGVSAWADTYGNNGGTSLSLPASWIDETTPANTGVAVPGAADIAAWDSNANLVAPTTFSLDVPTTWLGILIQNPGSGVTIGTGANPLTLGASGIDMSAAVQNLILSPANITLSANQTWNVAATATLTDNAPIDLGATNVLILTGLGDKTINGVISDTGTLVKNGLGNLTLTAANSFTGGVVVGSGNLTLNFAAAGAPTTNILASQALIFGGNGNGSLGGTFGNGHLIVNGSATGPVTQTFSTVAIGTGAASIDVNPGAGQTAQVILSAAPVRTVNGTGITATNVGGTIRFGTTGTITLPNTLSSALLTDAGGNPYATIGLNDWAGTDANGNVIPVTYSTTAANGTNFDMIANTSVGAFTPNSVRFNNNATVGPLTLSISGTNTDTLRGILMTPNSVGVTIAGATAFARPNRVSTAGADFSFIQNSTAGDLTILPNLGNASSGAPVNIVKSGVGRLILGNAGNGYTGDTFINEGTIEIAANGNLGAVATGSPVVFSGGTLQTSANVNLFNGAAGTNNRNLQLNSGGGTLLVASGTTLTVPGTVSGVGTLTVSGAGGTVNLGGANTNTGPVVVSSGTLLVSNTSGSATGAGNVTVAGGATLAGNGFITGNVIPASGAHIATGNGTALGTLTLANLTLGSGTAADFSFSATGNSLANLTGSLSLQGGGVDLYQTGTTVPFSVNGTYTLFNIPSGVPSNFASLNVLDPVAGVTYNFGSTGTAITVTVNGGQTKTAWNVDASGSWGVAGNWSNGIPQNAGDIATLGSVITAARTVTLDGNRIVGSLVFNNAAAYTVAAGTGGNLTLATSGTGVAAIADLLGNHVISAPVIMQSDTTVTATNATDSVTLSGGISGAGNMTTTGLGTVFLTGTDSRTGTTTIANGILQVGTGGTSGALAPGNVINNASLVFNLTGGTVAAPLVIANLISGSGTLTFNGNNVRQLTGANTFTGPINLNAGKLQLGSTTALGAGSATNLLVMAAGTTLDLDGNSNTIGSLSGAGTIDNTAAANATLTTGAANASPTFSGVIQNSGTGTLGLTKNGSGLLTLSGINTYTGGTVINAGGILITNASGFGTGTIQANTATGPAVGAGSIQLSDGITLSNPIVTIGSGSNEILGIASGTATVASNITTTGSTQYRVGTAGGTLIMTGTSTVGIASSNTSLLSILTRGNIVVAGTGSMTNLFQAMTIGRQSATSTLNLTIQDNGVVQGVGVTLGGLNSTNDDSSTTITLNNNATLSAGTGAFDLNNSNTTGSVTLNVNDNSTIAGSAFTQTGTNEGSTGVTFNGGTLLATGGDTATAPFIPASTTEAAFVVSGVTIQNVYTPSINISTNGMKVNDGGFAITIAAPINGGGDGGLTKLGSGSLSLTAQNFYTGTTTVSAGKLLVNAFGATGSGNVTLNGGTLGGNGTVTGAVVAGSGAHSINPGAAGPNSVGTLTLAGGLTTNTSTTLAFDLGSPDTGATPNATSDLLAISGALTLAGGNLAVTSQATTGVPSLGYYEVLSYTTLTGSAHNIVLPAAVNNVAYTIDTTQNPGFIDIHRGFIGDANDDGKVDLTDLNVVLNNLGTANTSWNKGNFDGAATIDLTDLNDVLNHLGTSIASGSAVVASAAAPEPTSLGLLALGAAALIARRRKA